MRGLWWNFGMYLRLLLVQLRSQMSYRLSFWMELASTGLSNGVVFLSLALIVQRFGSIAGWLIGEVAFLYGMVEASFGMMDMIFSGFDQDYFAVVVRQGSFDQVMLRPVGLTWQVLGSRFLLRRLGRIFEGLLVLAFAIWTLPIHWTVIKVIYLPVVFFSQVIGMGGLFIISSAATFWTLQSVEAFNTVTYGGSEMMSYPMQIYPAWLRNFFTFALPFIFLNFYPALYFLDKPDPLHFPAFAPFLAPLVAVGLLWAALALWQVGINHYQSAGS